MDVRRLSFDCASTSRKLASSVSAAQRNGSWRKRWMGTNLAPADTVGCIQTVSNSSIRDAGVDAWLAHSWLGALMASLLAWQPSDAEEDPCRSSTRLIDAADDPGRRSATSHDPRRSRWLKSSTRFDEPCRLKGRERTGMHRLQLAKSRVGCNAPPVQKPCFSAWSKARRQAISEGHVMSMLIAIASTSAA
eukprot:5400002-Prymnesium_polylepis.2